VTLRLPEHWLWDFWFAVDGDDVHLFFLHAPRSLGEPDRRHHNARMGHAVSRDLRTWKLLPRPIEPGRRGAFDDLATWTGSVLRWNGRWHLFYTGTSSAESGRVQRIGIASSDDLMSWRKHDVVLEADAQWYEKLSAAGEEHWRDPWVFEGPDGRVDMLVTARSKDGPRDGRGVVGHAWSLDLAAWEIGPPLSEPGEFRQLEVPQLVELGGAFRVLFSAGKGDHSAARLARDGMVAESGTHYLESTRALGPYRVAPGRFLVGGKSELYAGRILEWKGERLFFAWRAHEDGRFVGELSHPMQVEADRGGRLRVRVSRPSSRKA